MKRRAVPTTMKTDGRPASSNYGRASATSGTTGGSNGGNSSSVQQGVPASGTTRAQRVSSATRPGSSTYFDIANTILGSAGDLDDLLLSAARDGDYNKVEQLLVKRGDIIFDIDCKDKRTGNTALIWAAKRGHGKIVQLLLRHGADPTLRNYNAKTAVEEATGAPLTILLDAVSKATESSHRLLLQAAWQGNVEVIRRLLSNKVLDINCQNAEGLTPLMLVARDVHLFERLSRDLNMPYNPVGVAQELMKARADVHSRDSDGRSCLHYASQSMASNADRLTEAFLGGGSEPAQLDKRQYTPIHWASQHGNTSVVLALLDGGSEVNCRGFIGLTPLHISAHNDNQCTAVALLEHGADVTLTDDRGFTPVDLAKTRKLKSILKEAWSEATQNNAAQELAPVRTTPNRETGSRTSGREESPARRRGGEVIFDGMPSNLVGGQRGSQATRAGTSRPVIGGSERARRAERQMMQEIENGLYTPSLLHGRDVTRPLGTVRNKPGPPVLPNISKAIPGPARQPSPESPPPSRRSSHDGDLRRSLEDGRNLLAHRSNAKRGALPTRGRLNKTTPVSTGDRSEKGEETGANSNIRRTHRRTGSDPYATKITDVAATIENIISNRRGETSKPDLHLLASLQHVSPLRLPLERETTLGVNIPTTIPEGSSPSGSTNTVSFETDNTSMARHPIMLTQMMALPPTSNRILPPTPTFLTQRSYTNLESALSRYAAGKDDDSSSSKEPSPRSDDGIPDNKVRVGLSNPMELLRSRSLLKEEFILAESRPSDPFMASSGSDPASSSSSLSTASSSPREGALGLGRAAYRRSDPSLLTVTLREKAMKGTGFRKSDPLVDRRSEKSGEGAAAKSSSEFDISKDKSPVDNASAPAARGSTVGTGGKVTRSQSLRLSHHPDQQQGATAASSGCLKRSQSIGSVASESDGKRSDVKDSAPSVQVQDSARGAPFSGKGRMVVVRDTFSEFDNVFADNGARCAPPQPPSSSGSSSVQSSAKRSSEVKPESAYIKHSFEKRRHSSSEDTVISDSPRMSVSDVAISAVSQSDSAAAPKSLSPSSFIIQGAQKQPGNTNISKPPVPNYQSASNSNKSAGQKTVLSQASKQMSAVGKGSAPSKAKASVSASPAPSNVQANERKSCEEWRQGAGKGTGADVKSSLTHSPHVSASAQSNNPESKCVSAGKSTDTGKDRFVTVSAKVSLKDRDSSPDPSAMPVNRTAPASGNSSISKPTMSKTGPTVSSSSPSPHSGGQSPAQRSTSSRQSSAQRSSSSRQTSSVRKSASTESLATPRFSAHGRQWSGESGGRQSTISPSQRSLSTSARDVTARLSGSGSSSSRASSTNSLSNARSDMIPSSKSDVSVAGKTSAKPLKNNAAQSVSKGAVPAKAQPSQTSTSKSTTLSPTADSTSKPVAAISAATPKAVAKVMQTTTKAVASSPQSRTTVMAAQSTVGASSPNAAPVESSKCRASSSTAAASAQNSVNSKPASSATTAPMQGKSGQAGSSKTGSVQTAKPSSVSGSGGLTDQKSVADSRGAKCKGSVKSSRSPALMKSSSDSVLVEPEGSGDKVESMEKAEIEDSNGPSGEGIEPLVKITFSSMNPKTSSNISKYSDPATLVNTGPVIVNPFENLSAHHASRDKSPGDIDARTEAGFIVGKPDRDAAGKKKVPTSAKGKAGKGAKKAKDPKRPLSSSSRQASAGKRRGAKGKDPKVSDTDDARPKSGKRVRSGKRRAKKAAEREADKEAALLSEMSSKGDVAVISGIGWHVATACADTSDVIAASEMHVESSDSDISDVESIEDAETLMTKLEINRSNISLTSPRFREIKAQGGRHDAIAAIPALTSDGFPPMNLDINPKGSSMQMDDADKDHVITDFEDTNDEVHKELLLRKLTPIPEMPSINGPLGNVTEAIARFDRSLKDNQLSEWLDGTPRTDANPASSRQSPAQGGQDSSKKGKSTTTEDGAKETDITTKEPNSSKPPHIQISQPSPVPKDNKRAPRRSQSLKEGSTGATKERPRRERKFSESKKDEEEINTAIEEILSATSTSMSSTLKSTSTLKSGSNTLTEGDHHVLLKLKSHCKESPFHASKPSQEEEDEDASTLCGENSGGSGEGLADETNPNLLKVTHMEQFDLGAKVKAMIDAGADESKIKAMMNADQGVKHQEAKQIVKVMNSFRHMELHAGGSQNPREPLLRSESHRVSKVGAAVDRVPLVRPSSAGASRSRGRFQELKKSSPGGSAQHLADRTRRSESEEPAEKEVAVGAHGGYAAVVEALAGDVARDVLGGTAASETMCSRLSRHSSRSGSACTVDSQEEETIQWKKGNVLGKGAFGTVWCGLTNEGELIAVKQIELNTADRQKAEREYEKVQEEVELLKTLNHINIVGYLGTSLDDSTVSIFMQFVPGGSIASILARFGALDESVFRRYTRQILQGVEYLHDNDVIHRDIKGGNVMLMPNGIIKLIDFGCAKRLCINLSLSQSQILRSMKGTPYWMAPEVVNESGHGKKSDIWSIGCTVFEMATRRPPWAEMNPMAAIFAIGSDRTVPSLPNKFSTEAIAFVNRCLTRDQQHRPSATELLTDIFMVEQPSKK